MRIVVLVLAALLLLSIPIASAGGGGHSGACRGLSEGTRVTLLDSCFDGTAHVVGLGTRITVTNGGMMAHTYTAVDASFDSGTLQPGESTEIDLPGQGAFPVYCTLHSTAQGEGMAGALIVGQTSEPRSATAVPPLAGFGAGLAASALAIRLTRRARR